MTIPIDVAPGVQCIQFLWAVLYGMGLGAVYRFLRMLGRRKWPHLCDAIFVLIGLASGILFFLTVCEGCPRSFHLFGMTLGAAMLFALTQRITRCRRPH